MTQFSLDRFHWSLAVGLLRLVSAGLHSGTIPRASRALSDLLATWRVAPRFVDMGGGGGGGVGGVCVLKTRGFSTSSNTLGGTGRNRPEVVMTGNLLFVRDLLCSLRL